MSDGKNRPITVAEVAKTVGGKLSGNGQALVTDVTHDSRQAREGSVFVAVRGELFDAHKFVPQVIEQGAVGILSELEPPVEFQSGRGLAPAPAWIQVDDVRCAMALAAATVHHHPSLESDAVRAFARLWLSEQHWEAAQRLDGSRRQEAADVSR